MQKSELYEIVMQHETNGDICLSLLKDFLKFGVYKDDSTDGVKISQFPDYIDIPFSNFRKFVELHKNYLLALYAMVFTRIPWGMYIKLAD